MLADPGEYGVALELWNPAEFELAPAFSPDEGDQAYAEAALLLQQEWRMTDDDRAGFKFLARVAKRLNAGGFEDLPRTADFVVFAIDPEIPDQAHIERHLRACVRRRSSRTSGSAGCSTSSPDLPARAGSRRPSGPGRW